MTSPDTRRSTDSRTIPHSAAIALAALAWLVGIPLGHGVVPWAVSRLGPRLGWRDGTPAHWNLIGLVPVLAGIVVLLWVMVVGFVEAIKMSERVQLNWQPKTLLTGGPYRFSRHPMYVGELALWIGWTTFFGSPAMLAGLLAFLAVVGPLARREKRDRFSISVVSRTVW